MHTIDGLRFSRGIELRFHHEDLVGGGEIEAEATGADGDEHDADVGRGAQEVHGFVTCVAGHAAVEADEGVAGGFEGDFDEVKVSGPGGEYDADVAC